jgi:adenylate cyclase
VKLGLLTIERLGALGQHDVEDVVQQTFGVDRETSRHFSALLYDWTRGNPFFVEETLKSLVESGALTRSGGRWVGWDMESLELPFTIRDAIKARVERLSAGARRLADFAAVIGTRASHETLAAVAGLGEQELIADLDELLAQRVLNETGNVDDIWYDFTHPLLQQVIYSELGQARARSLHATVAEALEIFYGKAALSHADELAIHFARAHSPTLGARQ